MADTTIINDDITPLNENELNKFIGAAQDDGTITQAKIMYAHIRYNGSAWVVDTTEDAAGLVSGDVSWSTNHVQITLSGYTNTTVAIPTAKGTTTEAYRTQIDPGSGFVRVYFFNASGVSQTTESTSMDFHFCFIGV